MTENFLPDKISDQQRERAKDLLVEMVAKLFPLPFGSHVLENKRVQLPCVIAVDLDNGWTCAFEKAGVIVITWGDILNILKGTGLPVSTELELKDMTRKITARMERADPYDLMPKSPWKRRLQLREMLEKYVGKTGT